MTNTQIQWRDIVNNKVEKFIVEYLTLCIILLYNDWVMWKLFSVEWKLFS